MNLVTEEYSYAMTEEINTLRTNIQFAGSDKKVFLVTSCVQGEGKSGVSMKLGRALAELKKKSACDRCRSAKKRCACED